MAEEETREKKSAGVEEGTTGEEKGRSNTALDLEGVDGVKTPQDDAGEEEGGGEETQGQQDESHKRGIGKKEYLVIGISLLLVLMITVSGVFMWARYFASDDEKALAPGVPQGLVYELKPFFVPLSLDSQSKKFGRVTLVLELGEGVLNKRIKESIKEIRHSIFKILITTSPKNIENIQGQKVLAEKIISMINLLLAEQMVKRIFFRDVVVI